MAKRTRKRKMGPEERAVFEWEKDRILPENLRDEMETSYELPQIYFFLQLTKEAFNITHLSMYEVERMLLMPKASKQLCHIMTCLLCNPSSIKSKQNVPPMPYTFWTNILMHKLTNWFKVYHSKRQNPLKTFDVLGVEPEFWNIFPDANEIEGKDFQDFSFKQRIWLLKTVCDTAMHTRKTIQEEISKQPAESQLETVLGVDRYGARYLYFPQFLHSDLRVYRHCIDNKVLSSVRPAAVVEQKPKAEQEEEEEEEEVLASQSPKPNAAARGKRKKRRSCWKRGSLPPRKPARTKAVCSSLVAEQSGIESNSNSLDNEQTSRSSSKASELSAKSSDYETNASSDVVDDNDGELGNDTKVEDDACLSSYVRNVEEPEAVDNVDDSLEKSPSKFASFSKSEDSYLKESNNVTTMDDVSKSSKTDDEKLEEMNASKIIEQTNVDVNGCKVVDDEKLSKDKQYDTPTDVGSECASDELSLDNWLKKKLEEKDGNGRSVDSESETLDSPLNSCCSSRRSARIKHISEVKSEVEDAENIVDMNESEELSSMDLRDSLCRVSSPEEGFFNQDFNETDWRVENFFQLINDLSVSSFQLVADSVDSLKDLIEHISSDKTVVSCDGKDFEVPKCETSLLKRMGKLATSLEDVNEILKESTKKALNKLQREWSNFENGVTDEDQEQQDGSDHAPNRWLVGPQGCSLERLVSSAEQCSEMLSQSASSRDSGKDLDSAEFKDARADTAPAAASVGYTNQASEIKEEAGVVQGEAGPGEGGDERQKGEEERRAKEDDAWSGEARDGGDDDNEEPRQRRVLRARGVPSYTEQLFSDDESDRDEPDGWADIEAVYAPVNPALSTPDPAALPQRQATDSFEDEEDSDQDWILPGSRKRKSKRPSASRRLKTFQNKIQNIQEHNTKIDDNQHQEHQQQQQPSPQISPQVSPTKVAVTRQISNRRYNQLIDKATRNNSAVPAPISTVTGPSPATGVVKTEPHDPSLHSVLDIKDEGPIYDTLMSSSQTNVTAGVQPNYVVVTTGQAPIANYYVMQQQQQQQQQNPTTLVPQNQYMQPTATFVPQMAPSTFVLMQQVQSVPAQSYYVQSANLAQNYIVQNPTGIIATAPRQNLMASTAPVVYQQPAGPQFVPNQPNYVQYVAAPHVQPQQRLAQPRIINTMTLTPPRQISSYRARVPVPGNRMPGPLTVGPRPPSFPHPPNGAVIRSSPISAPNVLRPGQRAGQPRYPAPRRQVPRMPAPGDKKSSPAKANNATSQGQKSSSTSLIVLSDSDDEIEMIVPTGGATNKAAAGAPASPAKKSVIPPELLERMSEGGISLSPIKPAVPPTPLQQSSGTQLVVVVNETGSHYALALPNGSKLILTPEQVAQIRASNGGKLVL